MDDDLAGLPPIERIGGAALLLLPAEESKVNTELVNAPRLILSLCSRIVWPPTRASGDQRAE